MLDPIPPTGAADRSGGRAPAPQAGGSGLPHPERLPWRLDTLPCDVLERVLDFLHLRDRATLERTVCRRLNQALQARAALDQALQRAANLWSLAAWQTEVAALPASGLTAHWQGEVLAALIGRLPELPRHERWSGLMAAVDAALALPTVSGRAFDALARCLNDADLGLPLDGAALTRLAAALAPMPLARTAGARIAVLRRGAGTLPGICAAQLCDWLLPDPPACLALAHALPARKQQAGFCRILCAVMVRCEDPQAFSAQWDALLTQARAGMAADPRFFARVLCAFGGFLPSGRLAARRHGVPRMPDEAVRRWHALLAQARVLPPDLAFEVVQALVGCLPVALDTSDSPGLDFASLRAALATTGLTDTRQLFVCATALSNLPRAELAVAWHALWDAVAANHDGALAIALAKALPMLTDGRRQAWDRMRMACLTAGAMTPGSRAMLLDAVLRGAAPGDLANPAVAAPLRDAAIELASRHGHFLPLVQWPCADPGERAARILCVVRELPLPAQAAACEAWLRQSGWSVEQLAAIMPIARALHAHACWPALKSIASALIHRCDSMVRFGATPPAAAVNIALAELAGDLLELLLRAPASVWHSPKLAAAMAQLANNLSLADRGHCQLVHGSWDWIDRLDAAAVRDALARLYQLKEPSANMVADAFHHSRLWSRAALLRAAALVRSRFSVPERRRWLARLIDAEALPSEFGARFDAVRQMLWQAAAELPDEAFLALRAKMANWFVWRPLDPQDLAAWSRAAAEYARDR